MPRAVREPTEKSLQRRDSVARELELLWRRLLVDCCFGCWTSYPADELDREPPTIALHVTDHTGNRKALYGHDPVELGRRALAHLAARGCACMQALHRLWPGPAGHGVLSAPGPQRRAAPVLQGLRAPEARAPPPARDQESGVRSQESGVRKTGREGSHSKPAIRVHTDCLSDS